MEKLSFNPNRVMNLKEGSHFLAEILFREGIDIYKLSHEEFKKIADFITLKRSIVNSILIAHFETDLRKLDTLPSEQLEDIRRRFLGHYEDNIEKAEKLDKWVPLPQMVGYMEVVISCAFREFNIAIDTFLQEQSTPTNIPLEHIRTKIVHAMKRINQGGKWESIRDEVEQYVSEAGAKIDSKVFDKWKELFDYVDLPLQELYAEHIGTMQINEPTRDLQFRQEKHHTLINSIFGDTLRNWGATNLEHDINAQSPEKNRSVIELISNAIDANSGGDAQRVEVTIDATGYTVRDHGEGMSPYVVLEKLFIPKISGKTGANTIGRFGVGFYTALSHLKSADDRVRIETSDGTTGHIIEYRIHPRTGDVFVHTETKSDLPKGTSIQVKAQEFDAEDALSICGIMKYSSRAEIVVDGKPINNLENLNTLKGETTTVLAGKVITNKSRVTLLVNGVEIQHFDVAGEDMCSELALDFPLTCSLPESRSELSMDVVAHSSIKEMIHTIVRSKLPITEIVAICNALCPALEQLQAKSTNHKKSDNLMTFLRDEFKLVYDPVSSVVVPNSSLFKNFNIPEKLSVDYRIYESTLESIPGITKCPDLESTTGFKLYLVDFAEGASEVIIVDDKNIFMDRTVYEKHRGCPVIINTYLSNLDYTGLNKTEKAKGIIENDSQKKATSEEPSPIDELTEEKEFVKTVSRETAFAFSGKYLTEDAAYVFFNSDPLAQQDILEMLMYGEFFYRTGDRAASPVDINSETGKKLREVIRRYYYSSETEVVAALRGIGDPKLSCFTETFSRRETLSHLKTNSLLLNTHPDFALNFLEAVRKIAADEHLHSYYSDIKNILNKFPANFSEFFSIDEIESKFDSYSPEVFCNFIRLVYMLSRVVLPEFLAPSADRIRDLYFGVIVGLPVKKQKELITQLVSSNDVWHESNMYKGHRGEYSEIPRSVRGYIMYLVEGGELLGERAEDNICLVQYSSQVSLSILVQAKRDIQNEFKSFNGDPALLECLVRGNQQGVDSSKASRDIMHAVNNMSANDSYTWIRKVLENSLDAVTRESANGTQTPRVSIDTFLRTNDNSGVESTDLVIEVCDPVGMSLNTIVNYLLVPGESESSKKFGQSFFSIFSDAKEVLVKTSRGNGIVDYLRICPIKDFANNVIDFSVQMSQKGEKYKGTTIQKVVDSEMPQLEASLCKSAVISIGSLMDRDITKLTFRGQEVNKQRTVLAQGQIMGGGIVRIYESSENSMTQKGIHIKELDSPLFVSVPKNIKDALLKSGIVIDIPAGIPLIKSGADVAGTGAAAMAQVQELVPGLMLQAYLARVASGALEIENIPYDFFEDSRNWSVDTDTVNDVQSIQSTGNVPDAAKYLNNSNRLTSLLLALPSVTYNGRKISLCDLAREISHTLPDFDISSLPTSVQSLVRAAQKRLNDNSQNMQQATKQYGKAETMIMPDKEFPDDKKMEAMGASGYCGYNNLVKALLTMTNAQKIVPKYYLEIGTSLAHAPIGGDYIGYNLEYVHNQLLSLPNLNLEEWQNHAIENKSVLGFLQELIKITTHERQHTLENSQESNLTHNDQFFAGQRAVLTEMLRNCSAADLRNALISVGKYLENMSIEKAPAPDTAAKCFD